MPRGGSLVDPTGCRLAETLSQLPPARSMLPSVQPENADSNPHFLTFPACHGSWQADCRTVKSVKSVPGLRQITRPAGPTATESKPAEIKNVHRARQPSLPAASTLRSHQPRGMQDDSKPRPDVRITVARRLILHVRDSRQRPALQLISVTPPPPEPRLLDGTQQTSCTSLPLEAAAGTHTVSRLARSPPPDPAASAWMWRALPIT